MTLKLLQIQFKMNSKIPKFQLWVSVCHTLFEKKRVLSFRSCHITALELRTFVCFRADRWLWAMFFPACFLPAPARAAWLQVSVASLRVIS
ncbi:unnamed protein product [Amoebophrya sp. A120]|nr:unnamed protein product [Amoebophrya sp. A120]|eukprot:GSA120T00001939001.1